MVSSKSCEPLPTFGGPGGGRAATLSFHFHLKIILFRCRHVYSLLNELRFYDVTKNSELFVLFFIALCIYVRYVRFSDPLDSSIYLSLV